jgi:hypothetical protein
MSDFVEVDVESQGISMRWKQAGEVREISALDYESEDGLSGSWRVCALDESDAQSPAFAAHVEDSSDGVVLLIFGGRAGLLLEHESGAQERQPYLLLSRTTRVA